MKKVVKITSVESVKEIYEQNNVNPTRIKGLSDKFQTVPDKFKVYGLQFEDLKISENNIIKNVPCFSIEPKGEKYIPVGTFKQAYTDKKTASEIKKDGDNKGNFLVVNNKRVHTFTEGLSEEEIVAFCQGKSFRALPARDYNVYSPEYVNGKPVYQQSPDEALQLIAPKSYRQIEVE